MSHLVYHIGDEQSMAFVGKTPWHGLGQELDPNASIETWATKAHLDWLVASSPVEFNIPGGFRDAKIPQEMLNRKVLYRTDSHDPLSIVGRDYKIVQPIEVLEFYRDLIEVHNFQINTAGSLDDGRRVWALAKMGDGFTLPGNDTVIPYCLLMTSYDTSLATTLMFTSIRVVCNNTLEFAVMASDQSDDSQSVFKVPHTDTFDAASLKLEAGLIDASWHKYSELCAEMSRYTLPGTEATEFFTKCIFDVDQLRYTPWDELPAPQLKAYANIMEGYLSGRGAEIKAAHNTLWGALNAVTEYVDHHKPAYSQNNRFKAAMNGTGRKLKAKAFKLARKLIGSGAEPDNS
jgi:phage/plasmid-like protein (TIGR03299 family)